MSIPENLKHIHEKALSLSAAYKKSEADLLDAIIEVRKLKIYRYFECTSIFEYCVKILKLDPGIVYGLTAVAKKIAEVPELKEKIKVGALNVSTARRITSVITPENKAEWFEKAENLTQRKLEKEVAKVNPKAEVKEKASYLNSKRVRLELGLEEKEMLKLRRIQDLESQKKKRSVSLEETLKVMTELYLAKHDPVEKAKRAEIRRGVHSESRFSSNEPRSSSSDLRPSSNEPRSSSGGPRSNSSDLRSSSSEPQTQTSATEVPAALTRQEKVFSSRIKLRRTPVPTHKLHQVHLRDKGRCQHINSYTNEKCMNSRFIEIHHKIPLSHGGEHSLQNLVTLCSEHHKIEHRGTQHPAKPTGWF